jgi:HEPN domain-containing protein
MTEQDTAIAQKWIKQALHDLEMAEKNIGIEGYDVAAFLSHQAVEKLFKGLIAYSGRPVPKTHFIDDLGRSLHLPDDILEYIMDLSADYQFSRYPDISDCIPFEQYDAKLARQRIESAKEIFGHVSDRIREILGGCAC